MQWTSIVAIYALVWVLCAFLVMPFGIRTPHDEGTEVEPGHADSAPSNFNPRRIAKRATVLAFVLFGLYYFNYVNGWIEVQDLDFFGKPPNFHGMGY